MEKPKNKSKLLIHEPPLQVLPSLACKIGLNEAIVLQQLHFWIENSKTGKTIDGKKWVYNTYNGWVENFPFWSERTIQRAFLNLEKLGLVLSIQPDKGKYDRKKYYTIDYEQLASMEDTICHNQDGQNDATDSANLARSLNDSEITTETTTETIIPAKAGKGVVFPPSLNTDEFAIAWTEWKQYRTQIRKKLTDMTQTKQLKMLEKFGSTIAIAMIEQSISSGWQGLFELRKENEPISLGIRN